MYFIGLDTALVTGIALYNSEMNYAGVMQRKGTPVEQLATIIAVISHLRLGWVDSSQIVLVMEKLHNFRNAVSTRSLLERYGYLKNSLLERGYQVQEVSPKEARSFLGVGGKEETFHLLKTRFQGTLFSSDHADALAIALYQASVQECHPDVDTLEIRNLTL